MLEQGSTIYWIILGSFVMPILLSVGLLLFFLSYQKRKHHYENERKDAKLREQSLIIEKQTALQNERTRIASEMHDDLGGGLTTIKFLSQSVEQQIQNDKAKRKLNKIVHQSQNLVTNMSEIIWAMNSGFDTLENLIAYCRRYASEYLNDNELKLEFNVTSSTENIELFGEKRRNIFLVIKEALHNTVKHAKASHVHLSFSVRSDLIIDISDDGIGLAKNIELNGNGMGNMKKRIQKIGGKIDFEDTVRGTKIKMKIPLKKNVDIPPNSP